MIRKLTPTEFPQAAKLSLDTFIRFGADDFNDEGLETFRSFVYSEEIMNELVIYGAFENHQLIGILATKHMGKHVSLLFVRPEFHRRGIGGKLFDFAIKDNPVSEMTVNSSTYAIEFYRSVGFEPTNEKQETNGLKYTPMKRVIKLMSDRLLLRPFIESDLEAFFTCCKNPNIGNNAGWEPHKTLEESREILHTVFMAQENIWAIILKESNMLIGSIGIIPDPKRENPKSGMLGYWLDEKQWNQGYMKEAVQAVLTYGFGQLQLNLISAYCYPQNSRSQHVLERSGFLYEGMIHRAEVTYNGNVNDHLCYYTSNIKIH